MKLQEKEIDFSLEFFRDSLVIRQFNNKNVNVKVASR